MKVLKILTSLPLLLASLDLDTPTVGATDTGSSNSNNNRLRGGSTGIASNNYNGEVDNLLNTDDDSHHHRQHQRRNLVQSWLQDPEVILPSGQPITWTINGVTGNGLCGASYEVPMKGCLHRCRITDW